MKIKSNFNECLLLMHGTQTIIPYMQAMQAIFLVSFWVASVGHKVLVLVNFYLL